jgi:hypothetical protein
MVPRNSYCIWDSISVCRAGLQTRNSPSQSNVYVAIDYLDIVCLDFDARGIEGFAGDDVQSPAVQRTGDDFTFQCTAFETRTLMRADVFNGTEPVTYSKNGDRSATNLNCQCCIGRNILRRAHPHEVFHRASNMVMGAKLSSQTG